MKSRAVTLMLRYKSGDGTWKRSPAAFGKNGRIKPDHVMIDGKIIPVPSGGTYSIRHTVERKTCYTTAGRRADLAAAKCLQLERTKSLVAVAASNPDVVIIEKEDRKSLRGTAAAYLQDALDRGAAEAAEQARLVSREFRAACKKTFVDEVAMEDFYAFHKVLKRQGRSDRTVANKHARLASWLRFGGIDPKHIPPKPKFEQTLPNMYSPEQTKPLREAANPLMELLINTALKTGLRDQELMHLEFRDVNWADHTLRVRAKPQWDFKVKTWEQRNVPLPDDLLEALRGWHARTPGQGLIFPTKNGGPNAKLLKALKTVARQAGLNCGVCGGCTGKNKECGEFTLHRFRRTYLTTLLRQGIDLRTVQAYAGHKDIASTMRYLTPETGKEAQKKLNAVVW